MRGLATGASAFALLLLSASSTFAGPAHKGVHVRVVDAYRAYCAGNPNLARDLLQKTRDTDAGKWWDPPKLYYLERLFLPESRNSFVKETLARIRRGDRPGSETEKLMFAEALFIARETDPNRILPYLGQSFRNFALEDRRSEIANTLRWATRQGGWFWHTLGYKHIWFARTAAPVSWEAKFAKCAVDLSVRIGFAEELIKKSEYRRAREVLEEIPRDGGYYDPHVDYFLGLAEAQDSARQNFSSAAIHLERALESDWYLQPSELFAAASKMYWVKRMAYWQGRIAHLTRLKWEALAIGTTLLLLIVWISCGSSWVKFVTWPRRVTVTALTMGTIGALGYSTISFLASTQEGLPTSAFARNEVYRHFFDAPKTYASILDPRVQVPWCNSSFSYPWRSGEVRVTGQRSWDIEQVCCERYSTNSDSLEFCTTAYGMSFPLSKLRSSGPESYSWKTRGGQDVTMDTKERALRVLIPRPGEGQMEVLRHEIKGESCSSGRRLIPYESDIAPSLVLATRELSPAVAEKEPGSARHAATISLAFDSKPIKTVSAEPACFWFREAQTNRQVKASTPPSGDLYRVLGLLPGSYDVTADVRCRHGKQPSSLTDFSAQASFQIEEGYSTNIDLDLQRALHLTSPEDNSKPLFRWNNCEKLPPFASPLTIAWEELGAEGTKYDYRIQKYGCKTGKYSDEIEEKTTRETSVHVNLVKSAPGEIYILTLEASRNDRPIGYLLTRGVAGGYSWDYRFRIK